MIEFIIAFLIGWVLGTVVTKAWMALSFREILRDLGVTEKQLRDLAARHEVEINEENLRATAADTAAYPNDDAIEIKLEQHNGQIYAYRKDNDQFLGQGTNRDELVASLVEQFARGQGARLIIREEDGADLVKS